MSLINYEGAFKMLLNNENSYEKILLKLNKALDEQQNLTKVNQNNVSQNLELEISFELSLFSQLTPLKKQQKLFQFGLNDIIIDCWINCLNQYDFSRMAYQASLNGECYSIFQKQNKTYPQITTKLILQNQKISKHYIRTIFSLRNYISIKDLNLQKSFQFISAVFGSQVNTCSFSIQNLKLTIKKSQNRSQIQKNNKISNFTSCDLSYPLHEFDSLMFKQKDCKYFQKLIQELPNFKSIKIQQDRKNQLYVCHDMKGGYIQDVNFDHPFRYNRSHSYRYLNLHHTKIFNYFSHYTISIPPQHWRILCQKYKVKCLGTFIIQNKLVSQNFYLTQEFALMLIYIAKKCKFDGYLINIQFQVNNVQKLKHWLEFLTEHIHKYIPNSLIIWYDSVISTNGKVVHQNQINSLNQIFYQISDGFFTNYWWQDHHLVNSLRMMKQLQIQNKQIYVGNDCFGRGTFGGGKYQIYRAIKKILQIGQGQLNISLFAPGFTLEDNAQTNRTLHRLNEDKLFHGLQSQLIKLQKVQRHVNRGQGWKYQGDWAVTSHDWCDRQFLLPLKQYKDSNGTLLIKFMVIVAGTGPKFNDPYKLIIQVYDKQFNMVYVESDPSIREATQKDEQIQITLQIDCELLNDASYVKIIQSGKDAQKWAGNYGVRFRNQHILFIRQNNQKNWIQKIPITSIDICQNYQSFFNIGEGDYFYFFGQKATKNYDFLVDYDIGHIMSLNNIANVSIYYKDAYMGSSSILIRNDKVRLLKLNMINFNKSQSTNYYVKIVHKGTQIKQLFIEDPSNKNDKLKLNLLLNQKVKHSDWYKAVYVLSDDKKTQMQIGILTTIITSGASLFGQVSIFSSQLSLQTIKQSYIKPKFKLNITLSANSFPVLPYKVDLQLTQCQKGIHFMSTIQRYLVKIGEFCGFIYLTDGVGRLMSIPICQDVSQQLKVQVIDIFCIKPIIIIGQTLSGQNLRQFIFLQNISVQN